MININELTFIDNAFITDKETRSENQLLVSGDEMYWHPCSHQLAIEHFIAIVQNFELLTPARKKQYFEAYLQIIDTSTEIGFVLSMSSDINHWCTLLF